MRSDPIDELCSTNDVAAATLATLATRLSACDPAMLGTYAEHLVALHTGGTVSEKAWGPVDVVVPCDDVDVEVQVKAARAFKTFTTGTVENVGFSTRASRDLNDVWSQNHTPAVRADVWVFALHGGRTLQAGWRFFVVSGSELDELNQSTISLNMLALRFGFPIDASGLAEAIRSTHRRSGFASVASRDWNCSKCEAAYATAGSLRAHQARSGHRLTVADFEDDATRSAPSGVFVQGSR